MKVIIAAVALSFCVDALADGCATTPPSYRPITTTFERTCQSGEQIVDVKKAKSPVVKLNFPRAQQVTISTVSGATSSGGNGDHAQICIWTSFNTQTPCGQSSMSGKDFNAWDGKASCAIEVPPGEQYIRAWQSNENADELNTTIAIKCR